MSLINDMLRDLERRGAAPPAAVHALPPLPARGSGRRRLPLAGATLVLVLGGAAAWALADAWRAPAGAALAIAADASSSTRTASALPAAERTGDAPAQRSVGEAGPDSANAAAAHEAPERQARAADADASSGRPAAKVHEPGDAPSVPAGPSAAPLPAAAPQDGVEAATAVASAAPAHAPPTATATATATATQDVVRAGPDALPVPSARPQADATTPESSEDDAPAGQLRIARSRAPMQPERALQAAASAQAEGRHAEAERLLRELLARDPAHAAARLSLGHMHLRQGRLAAAAALLDAAPAGTDIAALADALARALLASGQARQAAELLQRHAPALAAHPAHHALLAAAWQQAGESARAAAVYRALLAHDARVGAWWLGLALSTQSSQDGAAALDAFRRARAAGTLDPTVLAYVDQRIRALEASRQ